MAPPTERLLAEAAQGLPAPIVACRPAAGGGNNRIYRLEAADGRRYALKTYLAQASDRRDRLGAECHGLRFLWDRGEHRVPRVVTKNEAHGFALFDWIEGEAIPVPDTADVDAALSFAAALKELAFDPEARRLPPAAEACLSAEELAGQVRGRWIRLAGVAEAHPDLARFLDEDFMPLFQGVGETAVADYGDAGLDWRAELPLVLRTLSPSDFGFHNAVRRNGGGVVFLDFEYFGWDDPVKLVSDFLLHPGMTMDAGLKERFCRGAHAIFGGDPSFAVRLRLLYPLYGLRWCMIVLNEYLPERWQRRAFAGATDARDEILQRQLAKARALAGHVAGARGGVPYDA